MSLIICWEYYSSGAIDYGIATNPQKCVQVYEGHYDICKIYLESMSIATIAMGLSNHRLFARDHTQIIRYIFAEFLMKLYSFINDIMATNIIWPKTPAVSFEGLSADKTGSNLWAEGS